MDAFNRRDLNAFLKLMSDDVEMSSRLIVIEGGYRGHEGTRRWWGDLFDVIPDFVIEILDEEDHGHFVITTVRARGHGAGSKVPVEQMLWYAAEVHDRQCLWWSSHASKAEALEAAGLSEWPMSQENVEMVYPAYAAPCGRGSRPQQ